MKHPRVLLVDDDVTVTRTLALFLEEQGKCEVRVENVATRALRAARQFRPNLILLDVVMPGMDGGTLAAAIEDDAVLRNTPIVFLTALISRREAAGSRQEIAGHPFLAKPADPERVLQYIDEYARAWPSDENRVS